MDGRISADGLYLYSVIGSNAKIVKYFGIWSSTTPLIIPSSIDEYTVTAIGSNAIKYTSSTTTLEIVIPGTISTIENQAITYYRYLSIYSSQMSRPSGWSATFGYSYYSGTTSESYRTYYWQGSWSLVNNDPMPV